MNYRDRDNRSPIESQNITVIADGDDVDQFDPDSGTVQIPTEDGSVEVIFGPQKIDKKSKDFNENVAELLTDSELSSITEKLLMGIEQDEQSRNPWLENMSNAISLLGLQIKNPP